jgi:hypothetical protein
MQISLSPEIDIHSSKNGITYQYFENSSRLNILNKYISINIPAHRPGGIFQKIFHCIENLINTILFGKKIWISLQLSETRKVELYIPNLTKGQSLKKGSFNNPKDELEHSSSCITIEKLCEIIFSVSQKEKDRCQFLLNTAERNMGGQATTSADPMAQFWEID